MRKDNSFKMGFYCLQYALQFFMATYNDDNFSHAGKAGKRYASKLKWYFLDFASNPKLPSYVMDDFRKEMGGDIFFHENLSRICLTLPIEQKLMYEKAMEASGAGKTVIIEIL